MIVNLSHVMKRQRMCCVALNDTCELQAPVAQSVSARYLYDMYTSHAEVESSSLSWGKLFYRSIKIIKAKNSNHLK